MNSAAPNPGELAAVDPEAVAADVAAALRATDDDAGTSEQLRTLEQLHQRLAAALTTIDSA
jgi:hypothetical protein